MKGLARVALGLLATLLAVPAWAGERPAVVVTDPTAQTYRVAIQRFADRHVLPEGARAARFRDQLAAALEFSSLFTPLDRKAFLGPEATVALDGEAPVACANWRQSGADALLEGEIQGDPGELAVEFRLWDVAGCSSLLRKRYRGAVRDDRRIARRIADEVVGAFTGRPGVASTEIAFVSTRTGDPEIHIMDADGGNVRTVTHDRSINAFPSWSADGRSLVYMSYRYRRFPHLFLLVRGEGRAGRLLRDLDSRTSLYRGVFDPSGRRLAVVMSLDGTPEIFTAGVNGRKVRRLTRNRAIDVSPTWSPDGRRIAFVSDRAGSPQIYVMDADGENVRRLTFDGDYNTAPAWSPDGRWIAYEARVRGQFDIWLIDPEERANGPLVTHPRNDESPSWSPDSRKIAFHSTRRGRADLYTIDIDGTHLARLTLGEGENRHPAWGPHPR